MKTSLAWIGVLLLAAIATSFAAADNPPSPAPTSCEPSYPPCPPCPSPSSPAPRPAPTSCEPSCPPCPSPCCDPCAGKSCCNLFKNWFHHEPKVKEIKGKGPNGNGSDALNSPVFPVHPFARSPRDYFMLD
jgi:hypothetical protein